MHGKGKLSDLNVRKEQNICVIVMLIRCMRGQTICLTYIDEMHETVKLSDIL
jgi:hypothetical protein